MEKEFHQPATSVLLKFQSAPIRVLELIKLGKISVLLIAEGCSLYYATYSTPDGSINNDLKELQVFQAPTQFQITGVLLSRPNTDRLLVISKDVARFLSIVVVVDEQEQDQVVISPIDDNYCDLHRWTVACHWLNSKTILTLTALNELITWNLDGEKNNKLVLDKIVEYQIPEIYVGKIYEESSLDCVLVLSGTVFGEVHLWNVREGVVNVLHVLRGHQGPITSIELNPFLGSLITTSDDRSARLYSFQSTIATTGGEICSNISEIKLETELFGHTARVYQATMIGGKGKAADKLATSADDGQICLWTRTQQEQTKFSLLKRWRSNHGAAVRCLLYVAETNELLTAGDDGSVSRFNLAEIAAIKDEELYPGEGEPISSNSRLVKLVNPDMVISIRDGHPLSLHISAESPVSVQPSREVVQDHTTLICFSTDKKFMLEGGSSGTVQLSLIRDGNSFPPIWSNNYSTPILNILWLTESKFLISTKVAIYLVTLWGMSDENQLPSTIEERKFQTLQAPKITAALILPPSAPRRSSNSTKHLLNNCTNVIEILLLGDENGNLFIYNNWTQALLSSHTKFHRRYGISCLFRQKSSAKSSRDMVLSTGRDGLIKMFHVNDKGELLDLQVVRAPFEWIDGILEWNNGDLVVTGFKETKFVLYSLTSRHIITEIDCGGAHRSYDFLLHTADKNEVAVTFVWIRNKRIFKRKEALCEWRRQIKVGSSTPHKLNSGAGFLKSGDLVYFAVGGESPSISLFSYNIATGQVKFLEELSGGHTGSIRVLLSATTQGSAFFFSGGGKSEVAVWSVKLITPREPSQTEKQLQATLVQTLKLSPHLNPDFRILDFAWVGEHSLIFAACSDGSIQVLTFHPSSKLKIRAILTGTSVIRHCITKVEISSDTRHVYGFTSHGHVIIWDLNLEWANSSSCDNCESSSSFKISSSPITASCFGAKGNETFVALGFDDGSISLLNLNSKTEPPQVIWSNSLRHASTILGICHLGSNLFLSTSVDGVACAWSPRGECKEEFRTGITDCQAVVRLGKTWICLGDGLATIEKSM